MKVVEADMGDYKESAFPLDHAIQRLRDDIEESAFLVWVPYGHMGA